MSVFVVMVEGFDNIGKSTFLKTLYNEFCLLPNVDSVTIKIFKGPNSKDPISQYKEQKKIIFDFISSLCTLDNKIGSHVVLCDRSIFGEFVYSKYRGYVINYVDDLFSQLNSLQNTNLLFIPIYANKHTFWLFDIPIKGDENQKAYRKRNLAEKISIDFLELGNLLSSKIHGLRNFPINTNNYNTLEDRNQYISNQIFSMLKNLDYFDLSDRYIDSIFPITSRNYHYTIFNPRESILKNRKFIKHQTLCPDYETCELGKDHKKCSEFGSTYNRPTNGIGNIESPKLIFVGEAPGQYGCGKFGVPFYGDRSGNLFQQMLFELKIDPLSIYVTNAILCTPKRNELGNYSKLDNRMKLWCVKTKLRKELGDIKKKSPDSKIIAIGKVAYDTLIELEFDDVKASYHPAYFIRMGKAKDYVSYMRTILGDLI